MASEILTGWGRTAAVLADVVRIDDPAAFDTLADDARGLVARGLGRSYGDAAQNSGGLVVDTTRLDALLAFDADRGTVRVAAGMSLDRMMRLLLPLGWFPPVTPGTRYVTVGGAIAADIHGKNHHRDGSFISHVDSFVLWTGDEARVVRRREDSEAFWATAGGMGLTGVVLEATITLQRVETSRMVVDTERAVDLDDLLARLDARDAEYHYSVAWIDCLAKGRAMGRGVITRGDHARLADVAGATLDRARGFNPRTLISAPPWAPSGLLNRTTVTAFNEFWYRKAPRNRQGEIQNLHSFFHPLDGVNGWNRLYGPRGFLQYQFVVPLHREDALRHAIECLSNAGVASFLAVLKRFGPGNPGPLSFPTDGWTLALDIPAANELAGLLDGLDQLVADAGGRVYLAKDSRMRPDLLSKMYPRLDEWRGVVAELDPHGRFRSDLDRRLDLTGRRS